MVFGFQNVRRGNAEASRARPPYGAPRSNFGCRELRPSKKIKKTEKTEKLPGS